MHYYLYIIYSEILNRYYIGYTQDLEKRLLQHNNGDSKYTSKANDWKLKYQEPFETRSLCMKREKQIKNKKSRKYIEWLIKK